MKKGLLVQPWLPAGTAARRWLPLLLILGMVLFFSMQATAGKAPLPTSTQISDEVEQALAAHGLARVLILLDDSGIADTVTAATQQGITLAQAQNSVLNTLTPAEFQLYRQYQTVPGLAGTVTAAGLAKLRTNPAVRTIQLDHPGGAHLQQSVPALGGDVVHNTYGITGLGVTVAVLDSGVDTDHPDLADDLVAQQCFTNGSCPPSNTTQSANAEDANGHGTHVTGIITSKGAVSGIGFAPAAKIVAVRVLDANGSGFVSDWIKGLDWVLTRLATTPVEIVNMSLGTFALYTGNCDAQEALMANAVAKLHAQGVTLFASSGNQGAADRIASPACNSGVIAVGATYDGNVGRQPDSGTYQSRFGSSWPNCADTTTTHQTITCFTNSNSQLDLLAPGAPLLSTYIGGGTATYWGTSQASPTAAGIAALLLEKQPSLTPTELETLLKASGPKVTDARNGLQFTAINALNALLAITPIAPTGVTLVGPTQGLAGTAYPFTAAVTPLTVTVPMTYQWQVTDQPPVTQRSGMTAQLTLTWPAAGVYTVTVQALNASGAVSAIQPITIVAVAPTAVAVTGPLTVSAGLPAAFLAAVQPLTVTTPLTYHWQLADQPAVTHHNGITDVLTAVWSDPGSQTITVTVANARGVVSASHRVMVQVIPPITVTLNTAVTPTVGISTTFTAQMLPLTVSPPVTYTWTATDQMTVTHTAQVSDTVVYRWPESGLVTVTVSAKNAGGMVSNQQRFFLQVLRRLYLPLIATTP